MFPRFVLEMPADYSDYPHLFGLVPVISKQPYGRKVMRVQRDLRYGDLVPILC
jgi:hypothetical protein